MVGAERLTPGRCCPPNFLVPAVRKPRTIPSIRRGLGLPDKRVCYSRRR